MLFIQTIIVTLRSTGTGYRALGDPLCCLQYAEMEINVILNPITKLFTIKDVLYDTSLNNISNYDDIPRIKTDQNNDIHGFYRFTQENHANNSLKF